MSYHFLCDYCFENVSLNFIVDLILYKKSGVTAKNSIDWKGSWLAPQLAAEAGLLLKDVSPFKVSSIVYENKQQRVLAIATGALNII